MRLVSKLAKKIINEVKTLTTENIIVINQEGIIIASTDQARVGFAHEGSRIVMDTKRKLYITHHMASELEGVKPGINLPVFFKSEVIGVIGITGVPIDVEPFAELIRRMTELVIREAHYLEKRDWETRGLESFFYEWIYINEMDDKFINRGEILGISFDISYQCILIQLDAGLSTEKLLHTQTQMEDWFTNEFPKGRNDFFIRWGNNRFMLIKEYDANLSSSILLSELLKWQNHFKTYNEVSLAIGVGKTTEKRIISKSYQEAKKSLTVAEKNASIVLYNSLLLDLILEEVKEETSNEYINRVFTVMKEDKELFETLRIYLINNQALKKSAHDLHIHINTLHYRLNQIKEITEIDPKSSKGIVLFYIALSLMGEKL